MSDCTQIPCNMETNTPQAKLYIAINPSLDFNPKIDYQVPSRWMLAVFHPVLKKWLTAQGRQNDARYALIKGGAPPNHSKFFKVAKIPVTELAALEAQIRSVLPGENPLGESVYNRQYVHDVLKSLVRSGIIREKQGRDTFLAAEAFAFQSRAV